MFLSIKMMLILLIHNNKNKKINNRKNFKLQKMLIILKKLVNKKIKEIKLKQI